MVLIANIKNYFILFFISLASLSLFLLDFGLIEKKGIPISSIILPSIFSLLFFLRGRKDRSITISLFIAIFLASLSFSFKKSFDYSSLLISLFYSSFYTLLIVLSIEIPIRIGKGVYNPLKSKKTSIHIVISFIISGILRTVALYLFSYGLKGALSIPISIFAVTALSDFAGNIAVFFCLIFFHRPILVFKSVSPNEKLISLVLIITVCTLCTLNYFTKTNISLSVFFIAFYCILIWNAMKLSQRCSFFTLAVMSMTCLVVNILEFNFIEKDRNIIDILYIPCFLAITELIMLTLFSHIYRQIRTEEISAHELKERFNRVKEEIEYRKKLKSHRSTFLSQICHEFNTPICTAFGAIEFLKKNKDPRNLKYFEILDRSLHKLRVKTNHLLDLAKLELSDSIIEKRIINTSDLVDILKASITDKYSSLEVNYFIDDKVPNTIYTNYGYIKEAVLRLLDNVDNHSGVHIANISIKPENKTLKIEVIDNGKGIKNSDLKYIREPFFSTNDFNSAENPSLGLGLNVVSLICKKLGGKFQIISKEGDGVINTIRIPFKEIIATNLNKESLYNKCINDIAKYNKLDILIVDDSNDQLLVLEKFFSKFNFNIEFAENGLDAINMANSISFNIILIDIQMPKVDGITAIKKIRQIDHYKNNIPIIGMSAHVTGPDIDKVYNAGASSFIPKPIDYNILIYQVCNLLESL